MTANFESGSSFPPLPPGKSGRNVTRSGTFIDVDILGLLFANDIISANWNGVIPVDFSDGPDTGGTEGYAMDAASGVLQIGQIYTGVSNESSPALASVVVPDTGIYFYPDNGSNAIGFSIGGDITATIDTQNFDLPSGVGIELEGTFGSNLKYTNLPAAQSGTIAVFSDGGTGHYNLVPQSSTRRHKKYITRRDELADIELVPSRYQRRGRKPLVGQQRPEGDNPWEYGLVVEDLIEQDPTLGIWDQNVGEYNDYHDRGVIAVLSAKANRSDGNVAKLNDDVVRLNDDVAALKATVTTLIDRVAELESRLTEPPV